MQTLFFDIFCKLTETGTVKLKSVGKLACSFDPRGKALRFRLFQRILFERRQHPLFVDSLMVGCMVITKIAWL